MQSIIAEKIEEIVQWTINNDMKINATKSKEMCISFKKLDCTLPRLQIANEELERVNSIKLVGMTIQNNLKWNHHVDNITKKADKNSSS